MSNNCTSQLGLFDSTSLGWGFDLGLGGSGASRFRETADEDARVPAVVAVKPHHPAVTYRLLADRALAQGWKARAADNITAIRLAREIEDEARPATAAEQEQLGKFTGFGASDLANSFFRRAGEAFRPRLGGSRQRAGAAGVGRGDVGPGAVGAVCPLHAGVHGAGHLARGAGHGVRRRHGA